MIRSLTNWHGYDAVGIDESESSKLTVLEDSSGRDSAGNLGTL